MPSPKKRSLDLNAESSKVSKAFKNKVTELMQKPFSCKDLSASQALWAFMNFEQALSDKSKPALSRSPKRN